MLFNLRKIPSHVTLCIPKSAKHKIFCFRKVKTQLRGSLSFYGLVQKPNSSWYVRSATTEASRVKQLHNL